MRNYVKGLPLVRDLREIRQTLRDSFNLLSGMAAVQRASLNRDLETFTQTLLRTERYADERRLQRFESQVFSQNGEDGILAEIFRRIGRTDRRFVEIGVEDGLENNTAYLLAQGWSGTWVDADAAALERARGHFREPVMQGRLTVVQSFVTAENVVDTLREARTPREFDLLSLDIDRNTYHIWAALRSFSPRVVVVEYNSSILPTDPWVVEYAPDKQWNGTAVFGASLKSFELLGDSLGYRLVGCDLHGVNAFFVREDLVVDRFLAPFTAENHYEPPRYWLIRRQGHPRGYSD
jgi:hypothetical protein